MYAMKFYNKEMLEVYEDDAEYWDKPIKLVTEDEAKKRGLYIEEVKAPEKGNFDFWSKNA